MNNIFYGKIKRRMINCSYCGKELEGYPMWMTTLRPKERFCSSECLRKYNKRIEIEKLKISKKAPEMFAGDWKICIKGQKKC